LANPEFAFHERYLRRPQSPISARTCAAVPLARPSML
jgi:hypothetical protein